MFVTLNIKDIITYMIYKLKYIHVSYRYAHQNGTADYRMQMYVYTNLFSKLLH